MSRRHRNDPDVAGVLVIDKPAGITSHDVVARLRRALGVRRIGHTGTLDPAATGVLVCAVGRATRLVPYLQAGTKTYVADMVLGIETDSQDADGEVVATTDASQLEENDVCRALKSMVGPGTQIPPMVSAVRVDGERLHVKARRGEVVERQPRDIVVHELILEDFQAGEHPTVRFLVTCSAGTYVRTLAHDVGAALGVGASLTSLRRLANGHLLVEDAAALEDVEASDPEAAREMMLPVRQALSGFPVVEVDPWVLRRLAHGQSLPAQSVDGLYVVVCGEQVAGIYADEDDQGRPQVVLIRPEDLSDEDA